MDLVSQPTGRKTSPHSRRSLIANWLLKCAQTFPMYGKTLDDFPDRADVFMAALPDLSDADLHGGFECALATLREFPVPVQIRELAIEARQANHRRLQDEQFRNQRRIEDRIKAERFDGTDAETRRQEMDEMFAAAAKKLAMP